MCAPPPLLQLPTLLPELLAALPLLLLSVVSKLLVNMALGWLRLCSGRLHPDARCTLPAFLPSPSLRR